MVGLAAGWGLVTAWPGAVPVTNVEDLAHSAVEEPAGSAGVDDDVVGAGDDAGDVSQQGRFGGLLGGDGGAVG